MSESGDNALRSLIGIGLLYIVYEFFRTLLKYLIGYKKELEKDKENSLAIKWFTAILFLSFITYFTWTIYEVMNPIILNLCIYG